MYVLASGEVNMCVPTIVFGQVEELDGEGGKKEAGAHGLFTQRVIFSTRGSLTDANTWFSTGGGFKKKKDE